MSLSGSKARSSPRATMAKVLGLHSEMARTMDDNQARARANFLRRPAPLSPNEIDEYGFARAWHREKINEAARDHASEAWPIFETWCHARGVRAFPATREVVLDFVRNPPVTGATLYAVWRAIDAMHDAYYWHTDANPVLSLGQQVDLTEDGTVTISDDALSFSQWGFTLDGPYIDPRRLQPQAGLYIALCLTVHPLQAFWDVLHVGETLDVQAMAVQRAGDGCLASTCRGIVHHTAFYSDLGDTVALARLRDAITAEQGVPPC